jgi:hypothetical protein
MPISLVKAIEILHLNAQECGRKMPPDVKQSLLLALDALFFVQALRLGNAPCIFAPLEHEHGYNPPIFEQDYNHPGADEPAPPQPGELTTTE